MKICQHCGQNHPRNGLIYGVWLLTWTEKHRGKAVLCSCGLAGVHRTLEGAFTYIYWRFLWVLGGRSRRSRLVRGNASYSGCSLGPWCCAHIHIPASLCRTRSCWRAGCTCTWDKGTGTKGTHQRAPSCSRWINTFWRGNAVCPGG